MILGTVPKKWQIAETFWDCPESLRINQILGCSQAVRQMALTHRCVGSNPTTPANNESVRTRTEI